LSSIDIFDVDVDVDAIVDSGDAVLVNEDDDVVVVVVGLPPVVVVVVGRTNPFTTPTDEQPITAAKANFVDIKRNIIFISVFSWCILLVILQS
jgi:hypothetical protein